MHFKSSKSALLVLAGIFFTFLNNHAYALNYAEYTFNFDPEKKQDCLQIQLRTQTDSNGNAVFKLPQNVDIISAQNPETRLSILSKERRFVLAQLKPNEPLTVRYQSCFINPSKMLKNALYDKELIFFAHDTMLVMPLSINPYDRWHYVMDYSKLPNQFHIVSSYPIINKKMDVIVSLDEFRHMATLAGSFTSKTLAFDNNEGKSVQYIQIGNWDWLRKTPEYYIRTLLTHQRRFWNDDNSAEYFMSFAAHKKTPFSNGIHGTHFKNFITFSIPPNTDHIPASIISISHELFHGWIGDKAYFKNPLESLTWFVEGFTDYYGARFALESGAISFSEYIDYLNNHLVRFYSSPIQNMPFEQALKYYDSDQFVYQFELIKGTLIAHKMAKIKDENNQLILDKIVKDIYFKIKMNDDLSEEVQKSIVKNQFSQELGQEQWSTFERLLKSQNQFTLSDRDFDFPVTIVKKSFKLPHYHFDMNHFIINREIKDLKSNSPEYQAGLRNGMKVIQHNILFYRPIDKVILLVANKNNSQKTITFRPKLSLKEIPQIIN